MKNLKKSIKNRNRIGLLIEVIKPRLKLLKDGTTLLDYVIQDIPNPDYDFNDLFAKDYSLNTENTKRILNDFLKDFNKLNKTNLSTTRLDEIVVKIASDLGLKRSSVLWVLRLAISSKLVSLPVYESIQAIGRYEIRSRLKFAINKLQESK